MTGAVAADETVSRIIEFEVQQSMASIQSISIIDSNTAEAAAVSSGLRRKLCSPDICGSKALTVYRRTILAGRQFDIQAGDFYHVVYVMRTPVGGIVRYDGKAYDAEEGAGVLLAPDESVRFEASVSNMDLLHMVVPKPPAAVEEGLPGGPGYFFDRGTLRVLSDASGGPRCAVSAPSPACDCWTAAGSRRPTPYRRAKCTTLTAVRHHIIPTWAPAPILTDRRTVLHDLQGPRRRRGGGRSPGNRAGHARLLSLRSAASAPGPGRPPGLFRDPSLEELQDECPERGTAGSSVVLRARAPGCAAGGVEPELSVEQLRHQSLLIPSMEGCFPIGQYAIVRSKFHHGCVAAS